MKPLRLGILAALGAALIANAQFGGVFDKAKQKMEEAQQKAKPATDRAQKAVDTFQPWSEQDELEIGAAGAARMIAIFGLVENPPLAQYVNLVGYTTAQFASRQLPWRFGVLDSDIVGAYALPGGYVFITRAALSGMTSEAQLAGTLGHEIIHGADRHLEKEIRGKKTSAWAIQEAKTADKGNNLTALKADSLLRDLFSTRLSRDKEDAADEHGMELAAKAGYAPAGLMEFLNAMNDASRKPENKQMFGQLLSTHPTFESRIAHLQPFVQKAGNSGETLEDRFRAAVHSIP